MVAAGARIDAQPGEVRKVFDRADRGSGVRCDEHPGFVEEGNVRVSARGQAWVLVSFDDEDVVVAGAQRGHARGLFCFLDAQVDAGQGVREVGERGDEGGSANSQERPNGDRSRHLAGEGTQRLESFLDIGVDAFAGLGDDRARRGENRAGRGALDELEADFLLKFLDLLGHRRG